MIAVDSSVWIDHFDGTATPHTDLLRRLLLLPSADLIVGDLVLFEVLSGYRRGRAERLARGVLETFRLDTMAGVGRVTAALDRHRALRARGHTASQVDMLIASYCLSEGYPLLSRDRDFLPMRDHLGLELIDPERFDLEAP